MYRVYQQVKQRLEGACSSFVGDPPDAANIPYAFAWGPYPTKEASTLAGVRGEVDFTAHITVVDFSPANVLRLASQVEGLLDDWAPDITGWRVFPVEITGSEPVQTARGVFEPESNRYPAWVVVHARIQAVKTDEKDGDTNGDETGVEQEDG